MSSSAGRLFRVTTFGESHGGGIGAVVCGWFSDQHGYRYEPMQSD
ncbi:MAG: hypothetical protein OXF04_08995, partial [bacterium]|nr:hypothetical protein [bacterium]